MNKKQRGNTLIKAVCFLVMLGWLGTAMAMLPQSISYQGYLTNTDGSPVDATLNISFRLYNVDAGGVPLWEDTLSVPVQKGLFSVELGAAIPFPLGLFDDPLWLGIEVSTDGEMASRKALTSVGFAFRAERAEIDEDTLAGLTCAASELPKWNGSAWVCAVDDYGGSPDWASLTNVPAGFADGVDNDTTDWSSFTNVPAGFADDVDNDTLAATICAAGEVLKSDGSGWVCAPDLAALQAAIATLQSQVSTLRSDNTALQDKLQYVTVNGTDMYVTGANLHIRNESGATDGPVNGLGNLIVGYDAERIIDSDKTGSHNLVVGDQHNYSRFGGLVAGFYNTISGDWASVSGGGANTASGPQSSVSGGNSNTASGDVASVSGGSGNIASGGVASVSGGAINTASATNASVSGGVDNTASGPRSSVSGGKSNTASGLEASVSGGVDNTAVGNVSSISGGDLNTASGDSSSVVGGRYNTASGDSSSAVGGGGLNISDGNIAFAHYSAILGGENNLAGDPSLSNHNLGMNSTISGGRFSIASGSSSSVSGGQSNTASGVAASISGGIVNTASGPSSSVSGGRSNEASGNASTVAGGGSTDSRYGNKAYADRSAILGGINNITGVPSGEDHAVGDTSTISGGDSNMAEGPKSSVSGGKLNTTSGLEATVSGGRDNTASGNASTVSGGFNLTENVNLGYISPNSSPRGTLQFTQTFHSIIESNGYVTISVERVGGSAGAASVMYNTYDISAMAGDDYQATSGELTWADGDSATKNFNVPFIIDPLPEPSVSFGLSLSNPSGSTLGSSSTATVQIFD